MEALVAKVSESKKTILVGIKGKFQIGYQFAWAANPDLQYQKGDKIPDFPMPKGTVDVFGDDKQPILHTDGSPVQRWVFA